jgi:CDP-diacylglycerol--serine O-phosphatidyltransferase
MLQKIKAQIPNIFTLLNLVFGCLAIVATLQNGLIISDGAVPIDIPEKIVFASLFIAIAAVIDFFDGFVARLLGASSEMGKQLDSLADVVSFGVAPGMIAFQFLRLSFAQNADGLDTAVIWLLPAFLLPCAGAYRLARFNIDTTQSTGFKGVPIPAAGLCIAALPVVYAYTSNNFIYHLLKNQWFWYGIIVALSFLMVSTLPMLALKFKGVTFKKLLPFIIVLLAGILSSIFIGWASIVVGFFTYVLVSLVFKEVA